MSDILIKNMKMPDNCEKCELSTAVITGFSTYRLCPILRRAWRCGKPEPTCPLIEVPQHGRLIDADALYAEWLDDWENECIYDTNAFLYSISGAPTIIDKD